MRPLLRPTWKTVGGDRRWPGWSPRSSSGSNADVGGTTPITGIPRPRRIAGHPEATADGILVQATSPAPCCCSRPPPATLSLCSASENGATGQEVHAERFEPAVGDTAAQERPGARSSGPSSRPSITYPSPDSPPPSGIRVETVGRLRAGKRLHATQDVLHALAADRGAVVRVSGEIEPHRHDPRRDRSRAGFAASARSCARRATRRSAAPAPGRSRPPPARCAAGSCARRPPCRARPP